MRVPHKVMDRITPPRRVYKRRIPLPWMGAGLALLLAAILTPLTATDVAPAAGGLQPIIDGARKEGGLNLYASPTIGPDGVRAIKDTLNSRYGVNLDVKFSPAGSMIRDVAKVVTELATGSPPTWDLMLVTDAHYAVLFKNDALEQVDWVGTLGVEPRSLFYEARAVALVTQFVAPAYNKQLIPSAEAPKGWEALLDSRWKGKIGVASSTHHWARLSQAWGEDRTTRFVEALAKQNVVRGQVAETYTRLQLGEILLAATMVDDFILEAKKRGAPVVFIENPDPVIATHFMGAPLRRARSRNAATLLTAFLVSPEGQALWAKFTGQTSMYIKGTPAHEFVQKRNVVALEARFAETQLENLTNKYGRLLGFR